MRRVAFVSSILKILFTPLNKFLSDNKQPVITSAKRLQTKEYEMRAGGSQAVYAARATRLSNLKLSAMMVVLGEERY